MFHRCIRHRCFRLIPLLACVLMLAACHHGLVRRVSEPAVSIQQLTVREDGNWTLELRLQNYSTIPMHFDAVALEMQLSGHSAGKLTGSPDISIGPESADVATLTVQPTPMAKMLIADTLTAGRSVPYSLKGTVSATPEDKKQRDFDIDSQNYLNPAPGLTGVLR